MKIGMVTGNLDPKIGGGARFCQEVLQELIRRGPSASDQWVILAEQAPDSTFSLPARTEWQTLPRQTWIDKISWRSRSPLERAVEKSEISLVWFLGGGGFPGPLECPFIATVWDVQHRTHPFLPEMQKEGEWDYRESKTAAFLPRAALVITGTQEGARQLREIYGIQNDRILLVPHPTPGFFLEPPGAPHRPTSPPYFLYPANFWPHKNHISLVKALALLKGKNPEARLVFTGSGNHQAHVQFWAEKLGVRDRIDFRGQVSDAELKELYDGATALTYASLSGPENLPPLEAMARGCPVLNSDFPGAREQLGDAAVFIPATDTHAWAEAMAACLAQPGEAYRAKFASAGKQLVQTRTVKGYVDTVLPWVGVFRTIRCLWA